MERAASNADIILNSDLSYPILSYRLLNVLKANGAIFRPTMGKLELGYFHMHSVCFQVYKVEFIEW